MRQLAAAIALMPALSACDSEAAGIRGHVETIDQRMKRQATEFAATPDIKGAELRAALNRLGIQDGWMTPATEENGVEVLLLRVPKGDFAELDLRALAKLNLDSRYRFEFVDPEQVRIAAQYHGAEMLAREQATALRELKKRGQLDSYPRYQEGMLVSAFVPQLEAWCGYQRGQAFRVIDGNWIDYAHAMVDLAAADQQGRALASFECVKRVVDATPALRHRFIGNRGREGAIDY